MRHLRFIVPALLLLGAIVALTLVFFHRLAFTDLILARGDTFDYFYPYWHIRDAALRAGQLPLWSPDIFMGVPLLANSQIGTFYPPNWLTIHLSAPDAVRVSILLHTGWALLGAYLLARRAAGLPVAASLVAAAVYTLGGHVGAHVEQINQLQGLAWLPWLLLLFHHALSRPLRYTPLLMMAFALQFLSGHTQTVFITGVGLALYSLLLPNPTGRRVGRLRGLPPLLIAGVGALLLASPQLIPTFELTDVSNRRGGLTPNEATAFSLSPFAVGRGLLPNYDGPFFGEYIAYTGVTGLLLAVAGLLARPTASESTPVRPSRRVWFGLALAGLLLAFGEYNPLYYSGLATLPGFNLFRVPARWLALFALGGAMLAGSGWAALPRLNWRRLALAGLLSLALVSLLGVLSTLTRFGGDTIPINSEPTVASFAAWGVMLAAAFVLVGASRLTGGDYPVLARRALALLVLVELFAASRGLPYNDLTAPETFHSQRFTVSQLRAYSADATPPARVLSMSALYFDPGDRAALEDRYAALGLDETAVGIAFTALKKQETLAANLSLVWGIPTIDGFDGGLLPTGYYTAFTSLLLPEGTLRTIDGRLRERLASPSCRQGCLPDGRWLDLTHTRYLITDKIFDVWHNDVAFDTQFAFEIDAAAPLLLANPTEFEADTVDVLYTCPQQPCPPPNARFLSPLGSVDELTPADLADLPDALQFARLNGIDPTEPLLIELTAPSAHTIHAVTLYDSRTGDFVQLAPRNWQRLLSSDIKLYENAGVLPRAFVVHEALSVADDIWGTEAALDLMRPPTFDPARTVVIAGEVAPVAANTTPSTATITAYSDTDITVQVETDAPGYLVVTDAYYPGWRATVNGDPAPLQRADVMFRAVPVPAGSSTVTLLYAPGWLPGALWLGGVAWLVAGAAALVLARRS